MKHKWTWLIVGIFAIGGLAGCDDGGLPIPLLPTERGAPLPTAPPLALTTRPKPQATPIPGETAAAATAATLTPTSESVASIPTTITTSAPSVIPATATASPATAAPGGWKTFVSPTLQVAVDYPGDWAAVERAGVVLFTSPQGFVIQLAAVETGNLTPEEYLAENQLPNTRCSTGVNPHGLATRTCLDTLAGSYTADFAIESPGGAKQLLTMSVAKLGDRRTFDAMAASVRLAP